MVDVLATSCSKAAGAIKRDRSPTLARIRDCALVTNGTDCDAAFD
jgi:hypothetical protein